MIAEVDLTTGQVGEWHRVTTGFTTRGCVEAPQLYRHGDYYYLLLASAGIPGMATELKLAVVNRSLGLTNRTPSGEPILTSQPAHFFSLGDPDAGHFEMYNPHSEMQKAGHGSLVETKDGEWYLAHLMARPLQGKLLNPLGRETSIQRVDWNDEGWLRLHDGSNVGEDGHPRPGGL